MGPEAFNFVPSFAHKISSPKFYIFGRTFSDKKKNVPQAKI